MGLVWVYAYTQQKVPESPVNSQGYNATANSGVLRHYGELLPITNATPLISLGEGNTPLVSSRHLARELTSGAELSIVD